MNPADPERRRTSSGRWAAAFIGSVTVLAILSALILLRDDEPSSVLVPTPVPPVLEFEPKPDVTLDPASPVPTAAGLRPAAPARLVGPPPTPRVRVVYRTPRADELCGAPYNPWAFNFCRGDVIEEPPSTFCEYFKCIEDFFDGRGYVVQCKDGMFSKTGGRVISCRRNGGEGRTLYEF